MKSGVSLRGAHRVHSFWVNVRQWRICPHFHGHICTRALSVQTGSTWTSGTEVEYTGEDDLDVRKPKRLKFASFYVSASEIGGLINVNPHVAVADAIERLWEKTNRKVFREALERNRLKFVTQEERLEELGALSLAKATVKAKEPEEYQKQLASTLRKAETARDRRIVKDFINTTRGTESEKVEFDVLKEKRPQAQLKTDANLYKKRIDIPDSEISYLLSGYIDGVEATNQRIIEIKSRQIRLFHYVPLYEQVQCQAYLFLTGLPTCEHVESFRGTQLSTTLQHDPIFWSHIVERLNQVMIAFARLMKEEKLQDNFLKTRDLTDGAPSRKGRKAPKLSKRSDGNSLVFYAKEE